MLVHQDKGQITLQLSKAPPENFCRPAVDPMLRSLISVYGRNVLAIILTGMGHDGLAGARSLVENGGHVLAQDPETSVVWGMPGAVAQAGICTDVASVPVLVEKINLLMSLGRI